MLYVSLGEGKCAMLLSTARQGTCFIPLVVPMGMLWGAKGLAGVQSSADVRRWRWQFQWRCECLQKSKQPRFPMRNRWKPNQCPNVALQYTFVQTYSSGAGKKQKMVLQEKDGLF